MDDFSCGSAVLSTLSKGLEIELSDHEVENTMLHGDHLRQELVSVIEGIPTIFEVHFMHMFRSRLSITMKDSLLTNLFDPVRHQVNCRKVEVGM